MCLTETLFDTATRARMSDDTTGDTGFSASGVILLFIDGPPGAPEHAANTRATSTRFMMRERYHAVSYPARCDRSCGDRGRMSRRGATTACRRTDDQTGPDG